MKKILLKPGWLTLLLLSAFSTTSLHAQVYNSGNLYVAPGTSMSVWGTFTNAATGAVDHQGTLYVNNDVSNAGSVNIASGATTSFLGTNWANAGTASFTGTGAVSFDGTAAQTIDGGYTTGAQPSFSAITINNTSGVSLINTAASVSNTLAFTNGSVMLGNNNLRLDASAAISGAGAGKFVATDGTGYLVKEGVANSSTFSFPVGRVAGDYTPGNITNTSGSTRNYSINVKDYATSTPTEANIANGIDRTWQIFGDAAGTATITLLHNAAANTNGSASNGATFNNGAAYITQQVAAGDWATSTTTSNGGSPVNSLNSTAAVTIPALASSTTSFFSKTSDIMSSLSSTILTTPKVFLQGAYSGGGLMTTKLNNATPSLRLIPVTQPYNVAPFNYAGVEKVASQADIPANATDWILVELRDAATPTTVLAARAGFLLKDGTITDLDGVSGLRFKSIPAGNYSIAIRHRNHLGIRTATGQTFAIEANATYDFTSAQANAYQKVGPTIHNAAMVAVSGGKFAMWGGNANSNTTVRLTGLLNDAGQILLSLGSVQSNSLPNVYHNSDLNLNGTVNFTGLNNDPGFLLSVLGNLQGEFFTENL